MNEILKKYRSYGKASGTVSLPDATEEECRVAGLFMGKTLYQPLRYRLSDFEQALKVSRFQDTSLPELLEGYFGCPVRVNKEVHKARQEWIRNLFEQMYMQAKSETAQNWIQRMLEFRGNGYSLFLKAADKEEEAACTALKQACAALDILATQSPSERRLAVFSAGITANPHSFDMDRLAGKLLLYGICDWQQRKYPHTAEQRAETLFLVNLFADDISSFTTQSGLLLYTEEGEHPAFQAFRTRNESAVLTLSNLSTIVRAASPTGKIYIVENQMVFSHLCEQSLPSHPPILCTSGQVKTASLILLDLLAASGCIMYYSGDFDPEGLRIADRMALRYPKQFFFWHLEKEDYYRSLSEESISSSRLTELDQLRSPDLQAVSSEIRKTRRAGYQELLLEQLLNGLNADVR
ncbi:MAG: TIGR02679 family protein [Ethanoligenens sp.]